MTKEQCETILKKAGLFKYSNKYWLKTGTYDLHFGEFSRPEYCIRYRKNKGFGIKKVYFYFSDTLLAPSDHFLSDEEISCLENKEV